MLRAYFKNYQNKITFKNSTCLLPISIGQLHSEGDALNATILLINSKFKACIIIIADSLYRHTLEIEQKCVPGSGYDTSIANGLSWLDKHKQILDQLTIDYKIYHWDQLINHDNYHEKKQIVDTLFLTDDSFRKAFEDSSNIFVRRLGKRIPKVDLCNARELSLEFLKEECAATVYLRTYQDYDFIIYPNKNIPAFDVTLDYFYNENKPKWLHVVSKSMKILK